MSSGLAAQPVAGPRKVPLGRSNLREAQIVIESWQCHYNTIRPHASLEYTPAWLAEPVGVAQLARPNLN